MESFYPARALRTHFIYAEPHNAETYYRFAPWERRYRRWLFSPNPAEIGYLSRVWLFSFLVFMQVNSKGLIPWVVARKGFKSGLKMANVNVALCSIGSIWQNRWVPTSGLNG